ncbi:MAG: hypothetical protein J6Y39_07645, partial [Bacteroidaceae bacterium]|nr:hypothetical protein [Bacteroidaceae bacterium]
MKLCTHIRYRLFQGLKIAALLLSLVSCGPGHGRYAQLLEEAEWMNRNDSLFTTDSVMLRVARHYDHWWYSHNTRMKAYYLLGCAYRDLGEAPAAIHYYNMAVERADTLSPDCDYATLFRVYGQMAMVYGFQNMPWEKREAIEHYKHFALLAGDTLSSIIAYEQMTDVCYQLDDTLGVYAYTDSASMLYRKYGYEQRAYSCYPTIIFVCVTSRNFSRAAYYMNQFEHKSGLFDESGKIESGRELYYYSKGLYYIGINKTDSAEVYFRRLLPYGYPYEAYKGLLSVYEARNNTDSIIKYVDLFENAMTRWMGSRQYSEILQSSALYKYERNQHLAEQKARQAQATLYLVLFLLLLLVLIVLLSYQGYRHYKAKILKKEQAYRQLIAEYEKTQQEYQQK